MVTALESPSATPCGCQWNQLQNQEGVNVRVCYGSSCHQVNSTLLWCPCVNGATSVQISSPIQIVAKCVRARGTLIVALSGESCWEINPLFPLKPCNFSLILCIDMRQVLRADALGRPRGMGQRGRREGGSGWGTHVNPWLIHVNVWQKPLQYCN